MTPRTANTGREESIIIDHDTIFFRHSGMAPMDMCSPVGSEGAPTLAKHFNIVKPIAVDTSLLINEDVAIARLWRCDNRWRNMTFTQKDV